MSRIKHQFSGEIALHYEYERPLFNSLTSDSMALSHVWQGFSKDYFQSDRGFQIVATTDCNSHL